MTDTPPLRSFASAAALVVFGNLAALVAPWLVVLIAGGFTLSGIAQTFADGGAWMYLVLFVSLMVAAAGVVLGIMHLRQPLPLPLHLAGPTLAALVGLAGSVLSQSTVEWAVATGPFDQRLGRWAEALAIIDLPRVYGLLVAASSTGPLVVVGAMTAFVRRGERAGVGAGLALGGATVGLAVLAAATVLALGVRSGAIAWLAAAVAGCGVLLALGVSGVTSLSRAVDPNQRVLAVGSAVMCALGVLVSIGGQGIAFHYANRDAALRRFAHATHEYRTMLATSDASDHQALIMAGIFALAAAGPALFPIVRALLGSAVLPRHLVWDALGVSVLLVVVVTHLTFDARIGARTAAIAQSLAVAAPAGLTAPVSDAQTPLYPVPVALHRGVVSVDGSEIGIITDPGLTAALSTRLGTGDLAAGDRPAHGRSNSVDDLPAKPRAAPGTASLCPDASLTKVGLLDSATAPLAEVVALAAKLRAAGVCRFSVMTRLRESQGSEPPAVPPGGVLSQVLRAQRAIWNGITVHPLETMPALECEGCDRVGLVLSVNRGIVTIAAGGGRLPEIAAREARVDQQAVRTKLSELGRTFPDLTRIYMHAEAGTWQDFVDLLDAASGDADDRAYDRVWIETLPPAGSPPPKPAQRAGMSAPVRAGTPAGIGAFVATPPGALPKQVIQKVINENKNQIRYCYELELQRHHELEGKLLVKWVITTTGAVASVTVAESTLDSPHLERCVVAKIQGWQFPRPKGDGGVEVSYPFVFKSLR